MDLFSMGSLFDLTGVRGNLLKTSVFFGVLGPAGSRVLSGMNEGCKISVEPPPAVVAGVLRVFMLPIELWPAQPGVLVDVLGAFVFSIEIWPASSGVLVDVLGAFLISVGLWRAPSGLLVDALGAFVFSVGFWPPRSGVLVDVLRAFVFSIELWPTASGVRRVMPSEILIRCLSDRLLVVVARLSCGGSDTASFWCKWQRPFG